MGIEEIFGITLGQGQEGHGKKNSVLRWINLSIPGGLRILKQSHDAAERIEAIRELSMDGPPQRDQIDLGHVLKRALECEEDRLMKGGTEEGRGTTFRITIPTLF